MTLHDQLERLAERADDTGPTGGELWDRGTRYRRRMRTGTAVIAAGTLLGLGTIASVAIDRAGPAPEPSPAEAPVGLPSRIWEPSPWLPGTDDVGTPGQVIGLVNTTRGTWTGVEQGVVAISATTGDYRFLDLPDRAAGGEVVLSPDGRRVGYWITGPTTDTPNTVNGEPPHVGVAVYDTTTGELRRHVFETAHGLMYDDLAWVDDQTLVGSQSYYVGGDDDSDMDQSSGDGRTTWRWDLTTDGPLRWTEAEQLDADDWSPPADGTSLAQTRTGVRAFTGEVAGPVLAGSGWLMYDLGRVLSPDGTRVAGVWGDTRSPNDLGIVPVDTRRRRITVDWQVPEADKTHRVHGWLDDQHVVATRTVAERARRGYERFALVSVDVATGESQELTYLPRDVALRVQWATDLLDSPVVDRPAPPEPLDPRVVTTGWVLLAVLGILALRGWRRRVQP